MIYTEKEKAALASNAPSKQKLLTELRRKMETGRVYEAALDALDPKLTKDDIRPFERRALAEVAYLIRKGVRERAPRINFAFRFVEADIRLEINAQERNELYGRFARTPYDME